MVIVVITLAEREDCQEKGIARAAFGGIGLAAKNVAGAVNEERAVLQGDDSGDAGQEEGSEGANPSIPKETQHGRNDEAHDHGDPLDVSILPDHQAISLQVRDIVVRLGWIQFENQPANVREEESFRDAVGIVVVIDVLVMAAMFARPHEDRVFKSGRAEDEREETHRPGRLKSDVREEPVITEADAESARKKHQKKKRDLKPVDPEMPEIEWNDRERQYECADEKRTGCPVDAMNGKTRKHKFERGRKARQPMEQRESSWLRNSVTIAAIMPIPQRKIQRIIGAPRMGRVCLNPNLLRREKINGIQRGDDLTTDQQLLQIVAITELFVAEDAHPKI